MKNQIISLTLCSLMGLGAALAAPISQDQNAPEQQTSPRVEHRQMDPTHQLQFLTRKLNLNPDQQSQILPILTDRQQQVQAIVADNSLSRKDRHEKIRAIREESRTKIEGVLDAGQKTTFEQMKQHGHQRRESHEDARS